MGIIGKMKQATTRIKPPAPVLEKDHGYQAYHSLQWWKEHLENGDSIELSYEDSLGDQHPRKLLFFDTIEHVSMVGAEPMDYLCFQKERTTLGNKSLAVPVIPSSVVRIFSVRGEEFVRSKNFKVAGKSEPEKKPEPQAQKHTGNTSGSTSGSSPEPRKKSGSGISTKPSTKLGFEIVEKEGRFYCPCGNNFGSKSHAVYHHKHHVRKQEGA